MFDQQPRPGWRRGALAGIAACTIAKAVSIAVVAGTVAAAAAARQQGSAAYTREDFPVLTGPYLGQKPPGKVAERFAPGVVATPALDSVPVFSPDGREVYWSRVGPGGGVLTSHVEGGRWTFPERAPFGVAGALDFSPQFFDSGARMLFLSTRPLPDGRKPQRGFFTFWTVERQGVAWGPPHALDSFYTGVEDFSAIADTGAIYLARSKAEPGIVRLPREGAGYGREAALVPSLHGFPVLVGPREEYLIVSADLPGGLGQRDLHIVFRQADGTWGPPVNMGPRVNSPAIDAFASLSDDGKYLFVASERGGDFDPYWLDASIISELARASRR